MRVVIGGVTLVSSALYLFSELLEYVDDGFSRPQLVLTYLAFALVPFAVTGLHALQQERADWTSVTGAVAYGLAYVFYAGTAMYALAAQTDDYTALVHALGGLYVLHGALMIAGGILFGSAVMRSGVFPWWTGFVLVIGAVVALLFNVLELPDTMQIVPSVIRTGAFVGMALAAFR
jgi:hypothetical protein